MICNNAGKTYCGGCCHSIDHDPVLEWRNVAGDNGRVMCINWTHCVSAKKMVRCVRRKQHRKRSS